jgi:hypothetical protein
MSCVNAFEVKIVLLTDIVVPCVRMKCRLFLIISIADGCTAEVALPLWISFLALNDLHRHLNNALKNV